MSNKIYEMVTENIVKMLEEGTVPWQKPWKAAETPKNLVSKKEYRGINIFLLAFQGYNNPYWLTFKQAKELGGSIKKGEKATTVVFWKMMKFDKKNEDIIVEDESTVSTQKVVPLLRYYNVFNVEQCENIDESKIPSIVMNPDFDPIETCEATIANMPQRPEIVHGGSRACYNPKDDKVGMPKKESFFNEQYYYSVLFHELGHSTGHESRLDRKGFSMNFFGSESYSKEELVAEMTAAFLSAEHDIDRPVINNTAAYIKSWLKVLKDDVKMVVIAAAQAQKAADFIMNKQ